MILATFATFINVVCRYCFGRPIYQAEEIATSAFVWLVFLGAASCYKDGNHIGIDCIVNLFPDKIHKILIVLTDFILLFINSIMAYLAITITNSAGTKLTSALRMPYSIIDVAAAIAFICMIIHTIEFIIRDIKALKGMDKEKGEEA